MFQHCVQTSGAVLYPNLKMYIDFYNYNMLLPKRDCIYECLFCDSIVNDAVECQQHVLADKHKVCLERQAYVRNFEDNIIRYVNDLYFHCGICNCAILEEELMHHMQSDLNHGNLKTCFRLCAEYLLNAQNDHQQGIDDYKEVNLENDDVIILPHTNWNMCLLFPRRFYCLLCEFGSDLDILERHICSADHVKKLKKCRILYEYGNSVVRRINKKYNHCGVCNMYMHEYATNVHIQKKKHIDTLIGLLGLSNKSKAIEVNDVQFVPQLDESITETITHSDADMKNRDLSNENVIFEYEGIQFCLNILSFNTIIKYLGEWYCLCCDKVLTKVELYSHLNDDEHKNILANTDVVSGFHQEFVRKANSIWAHCGICNYRVLYKVNQIKKHFDTIPHKNNFKKHFERLSMSSSMSVEIMPNTGSLMMFYKNKIGCHTKEVDILGKTYELRLHTFGAWHTIRDWGVRFSCCLACQTLLVNADLMDHVKSAQHKTNLRSCAVLESYGTHYLRVINWFQSVYCSYCIVDVNFIDINFHINSEIHKERKKYSILKEIKKKNNRSNLLKKAKMSNSTDKGIISDFTNQDGAINLSADENSIRVFGKSVEGIVGDSKIVELDKRLTKEMYGSIANLDFGLDSEEYKEDSRVKCTFVIEYAQSSCTYASGNKLALIDGKTV